MKNRLIILLTAVFIWVTYVVIDTSYQSNLFAEWDYLMAIPWMKATLWDFYANILVLLLWVYYRETNIVAKGIWTILFFTLGSIAVSGYVLLQLFRLKPGQSWETILQKRS